MAKIQVGVQLYSVRDDCARDLPGTLSELAKMGFAGVEFAGYYDYSAKDLRKMLDERGLKCCGTHIRLDSLLGDEIQKTIDFNLELGNPYLIVPALPPERRKGRAEWLKTATLFDEIAKKLAPYHLRTGYHNHSEEFKLLEGEVGFDNGFDLFFGYTSRDVIMQLDIGHVVHGGADPVAVLKRYPGRGATIHLQDYSSSNRMALLGEGDVPLAKVLDACEADGSVEWYILEQETYPVSPLESVARCLDALRAVRKP